MLHFLNVFQNGEISPNLVTVILKVIRIYSCKRGHVHVTAKPERHYGQVQTTNKYYKTNFAVIQRNEKLQQDFYA